VRQNKAQSPALVQQAQGFFHKHHVDVVIARTGGGVKLLVCFHFKRRPFLHCLDANIGWLPNDAIEPARFHRFRKFVFPIERVDAAQFALVGKHAPRKIIRPDEAVAAFDVVVQVGQGAFLKSGQCHLQSLRAFAFQHLEQQAELGHFHRLPVNIHAKDVRGEDALFLGNREPPFVALPPHRPSVLLRIVFGVPAQVIVEQALVHTQQERA
jgi:hypothetical protein